MSLSLPVKALGASHSKGLDWQHLESNIEGLTLALASEVTTLMSWWNNVEQPDIQHLQAILYSLVSPAKTPTRATWFARAPSAALWVGLKPL